MRENKTYDPYRTGNTHTRFSKGGLLVLRSGPSPGPSLISLWGLQDRAPKTKSNVTPILIQDFSPTLYAGSFARDTLGDILGDRSWGHEGVAKRRSALHLIRNEKWHDHLMRTPAEVAVLKPGASTRMVLMANYFARHAGPAGQYLNIRTYGKGPT